MALSIKSDEADRLARELAASTGSSITEAVTVAIEDRLRRTQRDTEATARRLRSIRTEMSELSVELRRSDDDILGYGDDGLPS